MEANGAAARLAWMRESSTVERQLAGLIGPSNIERLDFDAGREAGRALLAAYESARAQGRVLSHTFDSSQQMQEALELALKAQSSVVVLLMQQADRRGVYRLPLPAFRRHALDLLRSDGDSLLVGFDGDPHGLLLDREVEASGRELLTVEVWEGTAPAD